MSQKSKSITDKLDAILAEDVIANEFALMLEFVESPAKFNSEGEFAAYLMEGATLNVNHLSSKALSIPCGEYMVMATAAGHTLLVPVKDAPSDQVFQEDGTSHELFTSDILRNWNRLERTLVEREAAEAPAGVTSETPADKPAKSGKSKIGGQIKQSTVERHAILRAMEDRGYTVSSLARACGVDPPAISRILRTPKDTQGDPGGRNPSMGLAGKISNTLRIDPTVAFPDIFGTKPAYEPRKQPGNRGSGASPRKGKATELFTRGNKGQ